MSQIDNVNPPAMPETRGLAAMAIVMAISASLAGCSDASGPQALKTTVCDIAQSPNRLVQMPVRIGVRSDGVAVISAPECPTLRIELRLAGAATRSNLEAQLKAAGAVTGGQLNADVTGVLNNSAAPPTFTAEALQVQAASSAR